MVEVLALNVKPVVVVKFHALLELAKFIIEAPSVRVLVVLPEPLNILEVIVLPFVFNVPLVKVMDLPAVPLFHVS